MKELTFIAITLIVKDHILKIANKTIKKLPEGSIERDWLETIEEKLQDID